MAIFNGDLIPDVSLFKISLIFWNYDSDTFIVVVKHNFHKSNENQKRFL